MARDDLFFHAPIELSGPIILYRRSAEQRQVKTNQVMREAGPSRRVEGSFTIKSRLDPDSPLTFRDVLNIQGAPTGYEGFYLGKSVMRYLVEPTHWTCNAGSYVYDECRIHKDEMYRMLSFWAAERGIVRDIQGHHQDYVAYVKELRGEV